MGQYRPEHSTQLSSSLLLAPFSIYTVKSLSVNSKNHLFNIAVVGMCQACAVRRSEWQLHHVQSQSSLVLVSTAADYDD